MAAAEAVTEAPTFKTAHIIGPWRCTDQNTGASTYWEHTGNGVLLYFGDDFHRGDKLIVRPGQPVGWGPDGNRLTIRYEATPQRSVTLDRLSLMELEYRDTKGNKVRCRRP